MHHVIQYWQFRQSVDHMKAYIDGFRNLSRVILLVHNEETREEMSKLNPDAIVLTIDSSPRRLFGLNSPLLVDNHALSLLRQQELDMLNSETAREVYKKEIGDLKI